MPIDPEVSHPADQLQPAQQEMTSSTSPNLSVLATAPGSIRVIKRNGTVVAYDDSKISVAISKAFLAVEGGTAAHTCWSPLLPPHSSSQVAAGSALPQRPSGRGSCAAWCSSAANSKALHTAVPLVHRTLSARLV